MKRFKNWLIKKLGGYTKEQVDNKLKDNFMKQLDARIRDGNTVAIVTKNKQVFVNYVLGLFNRDRITCLPNKSEFVIDKGTRDEIRFINATPNDFERRIMGFALKGYIFL